MHLFNTFYQSLPVRPRTVNYFSSEPGLVEAAARHSQACSIPLFHSIYRLFGSPGCFLQRLYLKKRKARLFLQPSLQLLQAMSNLREREREKRGEKLFEEEAYAFLFLLLHSEREPYRQIAKGTSSALCIHA